MQFRRALAALVCANLASGCSLLSSAGKWAPIPSQAEFAPFAERLVKKVPSGKPADATVGQFRTALIEFIGEYHGYAAERRKMEWDSSGLTAYGGFGAVLGALADRTGLTNAGATLAGVGLATSNRYSFGQQAQVYFTAVRKLSCVNSKIGAIPDGILDQARASDDQEAAKIAQGAMQQLIDSVETVRIEASNGILGIAPGVPSRDELLTMLKSYQPPSGTTARAPDPDPNKQRNRESGEQVKALLSEVGSCVKV